MGITVVHIGAILCFFGDYSLGLGLGYSSIASACWKDGLGLRQHALLCRATHVSPRTDAELGPLGVLQDFGLLGLTQYATSGLCTVVLVHKLYVYTS